MNFKIVTLTALSSTLLFGCSSTASSGTQETAETPEAQAEAVVGDYLGAIMDGDLTKADTYILPGKTDLMLGESIDQLDDYYASLGLDEESIAAVKKYLSEMMATLVKGYDIDSCTVDGETASVEVTITGLTESTIMSSLSSDEFIDAMNSAFPEDGETETQEETEMSDALVSAFTVIVEQLDNEPGESYKSTFELEKENDSWMISDFEGFLDV